MAKKKDSLKKTSKASNQKSKNYTIGRTSPRMYSTTNPSDMTGIYMGPIDLKAIVGFNTLLRQAERKGDKKTAKNMEKGKLQYIKQARRSKSPRLVEDEDVKQYLDAIGVDEGLMLDIHKLFKDRYVWNPEYGWVEKGLQFLSPVTPEKEELWRKNRSTGRKINDWIDETFGSDYKYNAPSPLVRRLLQNLSNDAYAWDRGLTVPQGLFKTFGTAAGVAGGITNPIGFTKYIAAGEGLNNITTPFTGNTVGDYIADNSFLSRDDANTGVVLLSPGGVRGAVKGGEKAFNWGTMKAAELGYKPAINRVVSKTINEGVDLGIVNPEFLPTIEVPEPTNLLPLIKSETTILPWWKTWRQANEVAGKVRAGEMDPSQARWHVGVGYRGSRSNFPGVPTGTGRVTRVFDSREPDLLLWNSPAIQAYESSVGKSFEPTINVSGARNLGSFSPEVLEEMIGKLSMAIDPLFRTDLNPTNFRLSTNSGTYLNRSLLNRVASNLRVNENPIYEAGFNKAKLPYSEETVNVPLYKLREAPARETPRPQPLSELELYDEVFNDLITALGEAPEEAFVPREATLDPITEHPSVRNLPRGSVISNATAKRLLLEGYTWYDDILPNFKVDYSLEGETGVRPSYNDLRLAALNASRRTGLSVGMVPSLDGQVLNIPGLFFRLGSAAHTGMSNTYFRFFDPEHTEPNRVIDYIRYVSNPRLRLAELQAQRARGVDLAHIGDILSEGSWHLSLGSYGKGMLHVFEGLAGDKIILPYPVLRGNLNLIGSVGMFDYKALKRQSPDLFRRIVAGDPNLGYETGLKNLIRGEAYEPVQITDENGNVLGEIRSKSNSQSLHRINKFIRSLGDKKWNVGTEEAPVYRTAREAFESPDSPYRDPNSPYRNMSFDDVLKMFLLKPGIDPGTGRTAPGLFEGAALSGMLFRKKGGKLIKRIKY